MNEIVKLTSVSGRVLPDTKKKMLDHFDEKVVELRKWLEETQAGGFALLGYDVEITDKEKEPRVHSWVNLHVHHPADQFWLPDMAKVRIHQRCHDDR